MFDLYADWCAPCKILSPMLEEIAKENKDKVTVYKINIDKNPGIAAALNVTGIPFVILVKNKQVVNAFTGVQSKDTYVRAINIHSQKDSEKTSFTPDGKIVNGIREIRLSTTTSPDKIYVYRGETIKLIIEKVEFPYSIHIPEYKISKDGIVGKDLSVTFKAKETGVFPIFCNGKCPTGDGANYGQIVVMQYESKGDAKFTELTVKEAEKLIKNSKPLILDVRTPNEFYGGHLPDAKLIPLQQLEQRLPEIEDYKNKDILVYCRSGNRSTVASEILISNGFKKLYNLRNGIVGWKKEGKPVVK
jgi:thioredoxin